MKKLTKLKILSELNLGTSVERKLKNQAKLWTVQLNKDITMLEETEMPTYVEQRKRLRGAIIWIDNFFL